MKALFTFLFAIGACAITFAQQNVGIGVVDPASRLHIHQAGGYYNALQLTNQSTDSLDGDGLLFAIGDAGEAYITNIENENLSIGTSGASILNILANGSIGINTTTMIGSADLLLKSDNPSSYGGMSVQHTNEENARPFYGYIVGNDIKGWHYFDQASDTWRLNVSGDKMAVTSSGRVGIGTTNPHASAILDISSSNKGVLLPRMSTTDRNNINSPAEGLLVYDNTLKENYLFDGVDWKNMGGGLWQTHANGINYDGRVGIGSIISSSSKLTVTANSTTGVRVRSTYDGANTQYLTDSRIAANGTGSRYATFSQVASNATTGTSYGVFGQALVVNPTEPNYGVYGQILGITSETAYAIYGEGFEANHMAGYFRGEVRVGNSAGPTGTIHIDPNGQSSAGTIELFDNDGDRTFLLRGNENTSEGSDMYMYNEEEEVTIQLDADAAGNGHGAIEVYDADGVKTVSILGAETNTQGATVFLRNAINEATIELDADIGGKGRIITQELQITGGADLAEYFKSSEANLAPGSVVVIDPENPAGIKLATSYKDKAVVGVISGANGIDPGMMMGQQGTEAFGDHPVAIVGRVYVRIDESYGQIQPGDFLTTSDDPGKACKVRKHKKAVGAILGKALTPTDENGYALVLIQLQ